jgi:hypothetical protein
MSTEVETFSRKRARPSISLRGEPLALPDQAQEEVLGLDGVAPELAGFVASEEDDAPGPLRVALEH